MKASTQIAQTAEPKKGATTPARVRVGGAPVEVRDEVHDERMRATLSERVMRPVQRKSAGDGGYGDLVAAACTALPRKSNVGVRSDPVGQLSRFFGQDGGRDSRPVQRATNDATEPEDLHRVVERGVSGNSEPLPYLDRIRRSFGPAHDVSQVRAHIGGAAAAAAEHIGAEAYATGDSAAFRRTPSLHTAAHEAAHLVQQRVGVHLRDGIGRVGDPYERNADAVADRVVAGASAADLLPAQATTRGMGGGDGAPIQRQQRDEQSEPGWIPSENGILLVTSATDVYVLPARDIVYVPDAATLQSMRTTRAAEARDVGALLAAPAVGAGGTRVIQVGTRSAIALDAGADTRGVPTRVYLGQLQAALARVGVTEVTQFDLIHVHADHVNQLAAALSAHPRARVRIARQFLNQPLVQRALAAIRADLRFGPTWNPETPSASQGTRNMVTMRYTRGNVVVEQIGLRSALANVGANADLASFLTRVTRTTDSARVVVLGDLRMADLATFRTAMEADRPGWWNEFFANVTTLSGFSHHRGRMTDQDVVGLMSLLDATYFRTGRLRVVEQTNPAVHGRARRDTLELMQRLGITVAETHMPGGAGTSTAEASRDRVRASGPDAAAPAPIQSPLTQGMERLQRLINTRQTLQRWRPMAVAQGAEQTAWVDEHVGRIEQSITDLTRALRDASETAARVRTGGTTTPTGSRDYTATGGVRGQAHQTALGAIPATTPAEQALGPQGFRELEQLAAVSPEEVPLRVALHRALTEGTYSDQAFRYMLNQMDPRTRDSILYGRRGGPRPRLQQFQRLRAQFGFQSSVMPSGHTMSVSGMPRGQARAFRGVAGLLLLIEAVNLGSEINQTIQVGRSLSRQRNVHPFLRRILFWQQLGVRPALVGVEDPTLGSPTYERDYGRVAQGLSADQWDGLFIEHAAQRPSISDADLLQLGIHLANYVRNYDEYAALFVDSHQDAVRWIGGGSGGWEQAEWQVHVGRYETSGENHVEANWQPHPGLTQMMRMFTGRIMANTDRLIELRGQGRAPAEGAPDSAIGGLVFEGGTQSESRPEGRARLRTQQAATTVYVRQSGQSAGIGGHMSDRLERRVTWSSPPVFYVHGRTDDGYVRVSGADFNTFVVLRGLAREHYTLYMGGPQGRMWSQMTQVGNEGGVVEIPEALIERAQ